MSLCCQQKCRNYSNALVNQTALLALCFFLNRLQELTGAHNMRTQPWPFVSNLALLDDKLVGLCLHLISTSSHGSGSYDGMIATSH